MPDAAPLGGRLTVPEPIKLAVGAASDGLCTVMATLLAIQALMQKNDSGADELRVLDFALAELDDVQKLLDPHV